MIDRFTRQQLLELVQQQNAPCISMYLATEKSGREIYKPATNLKQLIDTAKQRLAGNWMGDADADRFLQPVTELARDDDFWQSTELGLALFLNADRLQKWRVAEPFAEEVFVSRQFFVRPILQSAFRVEPFFVLALSQHKAELFEGDESRFARVYIPEMPASIEAAMNVTSVERGSSVHTGSREYQGKQGGVFHGHGGKPEVSREEAEFYFRQVDQAITRHLGDSLNPMVLATVENQASIYKDINSYRNLIEDVAVGNPDRLSEQQLHAQTLPLLQNHLNKARDSAITSYRENQNTTNTLSETSEIVAAAHLGKIDKLFLHPTAQLSGEFNPSDQTIDYDCSTSDCDLDLVEDAISQTITHQGDVFVLAENEMPTNQPMVATLRFA